MAKYVEIAGGDMDAFLKSHGFKELRLAGTYERVYGKRVWMQGSDRQLTLRVYTSISNREGVAREKGTDAIRTVLFWREIVKDAEGNEKANEPRPIGGSRRVHRVEGWRNNLGNRLASWPELLGPECPKCGRPMVEREYKGKSFWGCAGYRREGNGCNGSMDMGLEEAPRCPKCNHPMKLRNGRNGDFYGCTQYPKCNGTLDVRDVG